MSDELQSDIVESIPGFPYAEVERVILEQRKLLRSGVKGIEDAVQEQQNKINFIDRELRDWNEKLQNLLKSFSNYFSYDEVRMVAEPDENLVLSLGRLGGYALDAKFRADLAGALDQAERLLYEVSRKRFSGRARSEATLELTSFSQNVSVLRTTRTAAEKEKDVIRRKLTEQLAATRGQSDQLLTSAIEAAREKSGDMPAPMKPWAAHPWDEWVPGESSPAVFGGYLIPDRDDSLGSNADFGTGTYLPNYLPTRTGMHLLYPNDKRERSLGLARSTLARILTAIEPGKARFNIFDPVGLGQSVSNLLELGEFDPELIGGKVWSSSADLQKVLSEQTAHIELVIQKYLRNHYQSIDEFNAEAGEIAEPYRFLVIFDFPAGFNEETFAELIRIVSNGPRCGVATILLTNIDTPAPTWFQWEAIAKFQCRISLQAKFESEASGYKMELDFWPDSDADIPTGVMESIIHQIGESAKTNDNASVGFERTMQLFVEAAAKGIRSGLPHIPTHLNLEDESSWWSCQTTDGISAPLGQAGARDVAVLTLDSGDHAGALLVGRPGSGKSTLLHTFIAGATTLYGPDELELYLIDFKEGVEFKGYASSGLPHAKCVAVETDREFGLSVLEALDAEISRRGELLRSTQGDHTGLQSLRNSTGEKLPRVLLVFDEFHVLFSINDKVGAAAATLLETLIRQGRGFGVHVILGSQSLSGLDALGNHVPQLLPVRLLLAAADADARRVMGDDNDAGKYLSHRGEAVLNSSAGQVEANEHFKVAFLDEGQRADHLRRLRALADAQGFTRRPVVFEGNAPASIEDVDPRIFFEEMAGSSESRQMRIRLALPMSLSGVADIVLRRENGGNVLLIARDTGSLSVASSAATGNVGISLSMLTNVVASVLCAGATTHVVDFTAAEDGVEEALGVLVSPERASLHRRRQLRDLMQEILSELHRRFDADSRSTSPIVLVLHGIHRAREFDTESLDYDSDGESLPDMLIELLRDGPEQGIHVVIWSESVGGVARRLPSQALRECSWRVSGKMSIDDSQSFIDSDAAVSLRDQQVVITNDDLGFSRRCTAFSHPSDGWLERLLGFLS